MTKPLVYGFKPIFKWKKNFELKLLPETTFEIHEKLNFCYITQTDVADQWNEWSFSIFTIFDLHNSTLLE